MNPTRLIAIAVAMLALAACNSTRNPADQPALAPKTAAAPVTEHYGLKPGTIIEWKRTRDEQVDTPSSKVIGTKGLAIVRERADGSSGYIVPFCWGCVVNNPSWRYTYRFDEEKYGALWPLAVGKSTTFTRIRSDNGRSWTHTLTVAAKETLRTPAGTFDAYRVTGRVALNGGDWNALATYWWAPEVGYIVKAESQQSLGQPRQFNFVATKVQVAPNAETGHVADNIVGRNLVCEAGAESFPARLNPDGTMTANGKPSTWKRIDGGIYSGAASKNLLVTPTPGGAYVGEWDCRVVG